MFDNLAVLEYFYSMPEINQEKMLGTDPESDFAIKI